jgi:glycosyltransferase involved in cell wall biosynthesis
MPNVLIHAVGVGANVVATDCEHGPREVLDGGRWGRLVPPGDTDAFARSLEAALDQGIAGSRRQAMNYAERAFSIDGALDSLVQIATADDNRPSPESR